MWSSLKLWLVGISQKVWLVVFPMLKGAAVAWASDPAVQKAAKEAVLAAAARVGHGSITKDAAFAEAVKALGATTKVSTAGYLAVAIQVAFDALKTDKQIPY